MRREFRNCGNAIHAAKFVNFNLDRGVAPGKCSAVTPRHRPESYPVAPIQASICLSGGRNRGREATAQCRLPERGEVMAPTRRRCGHGPRRRAFPAGSVRAAAAFHPMHLELARDRRSACDERAAGHRG